MVQFLRQARREGQPLGRTFWVGGTIAGGAEDRRSPRFGPPRLDMAPAMVWGVSLPWTLLVSAVIGFWLMAAPAVFDATGAAADSDFLVGPLAAVVAVIAMAEVARPLRFVNAGFGLWLLAAPWLLAGATTGSTVNDAIAGLALIAASLPRGPVRERYGDWPQAGASLPRGGAGAARAERFVAPLSQQGSSCTAQWGLSARRHAEPVEGSLSLASTTKGFLGRLR